MLLEVGYGYLRTTRSIKSSEVAAPGDMDTSSEERRSNWQRSAHVRRECQIETIVDGKRLLRTGLK